MDGWILTLIIFSPLLGVALLVAPSAGAQRPARSIALGSTLLTLALTGFAVVRFHQSAPQQIGGLTLSLVQSTAWPILGSNRADVDIAYRVGVDGIGIWLLALTGLLMPLAVWSSFTAIREKPREYYLCMLVLQVALAGVFCAADLLLFYVCFEFTLLPLFVLIGIWGGPDRRRAANKFFVFTIAGSLLTFAGMAYLAYLTYAQTGRMTMNLGAILDLSRSGRLSFGAQWWLFLAFAAGFAVKVPLFPLHTWLPLAHTEAPTAGSVLLAGVLLKLGTFGFCRISLPLFPLAARELAPWMALLAVIGILYAALAAWVQTDVKKLVAYSSVSHLGFCVLGLFSLTMTGVTGSVLYMVNHGLSTGALFLLIGFMYERYHTRDIRSVGGLAKAMPWFSFFLVFFALTSIGLPGLNGFVSEFLVLAGTALSNHGAGSLGMLYTVPAAIGVILSAVYMLWMCRCVLFGPLVEPPHTPDLTTGLSKDLTAREMILMTVLAIPCLWLGVYPKSLTDSMQASIASNVLVKAEKSGGRIEFDELSSFTDSIPFVAVVLGANSREKAAP